MMRKIRPVGVIAAVCAVGVLTGWGCEERSEAPAPGQAEGVSIEGAAEDLAGALQQGKAKAIEAAREGLAGVEKEISELRSRTQSAAADKQPALERTLKNAETKLVGLRTRLGEMGKQSEEGWREFATEFQRDLKELRESVTNALAELREG